MMNVEIRWEVQPLGNDLVALAVPFKTGRDDGLADRNVRVHSNFTLTGSDDAADEIAYRDGHFPPALFPCANAACRPDVGIFIQTVARAARHRSQGMIDQIDGLVENRKFLAPVE